MRSNASWKYAVTNAISAFRLITQHLTNTVILIVRCMAAFHAGSQFVIAIFYFCSSSEDSAATPSIRMDKSGLWRFIGRSSHIFRCRSIGAVGITSVSGGHFGGSKLLAEFCAKPILHYTLQATSGLFANRVVVTRSAEADHFAQSCGVRTVLHSLPARRAGGRTHPQLVRCVQAQRAEELLDIDTKEDLETLQRRILNE